MNKLILILTLSLFIFHPSLMAERETFNRVRLFLEDGKVNKLTHSMIKNLTPIEKNDIYSLYKKENLVAPIFLNILVGFGIGSYIMGDTISGLILTTTSSFSLVALLRYDQHLSLYGTSDTNLFLSIVGLGIFNLVYGVITPIMYNNNYNKKLRALFLSKVNFHIEDRMITQSINEKNRIEKVYSLTYNWAF